MNRNFSEVHRSMTSKVTISADLNSISVVSKLGQVAWRNINGTVTSFAAAEVLTSGLAAVSAVVRDADAVDAKRHAIET